MRNLNLSFYIFALLPASLFAQGPFFTHFYGNEALFNPALTGYRGALSIGLKAKQQWNSKGVEGYETYQLALEESMPCNFFDYGLSLMQDTEGAGMLRTQQFGGMLAAPLRLSPASAKNIAQLRLGIGLHWGRQYIDYSRLLFIDQLDPKYGLLGADGLPIPTAFTPPNDGYSNWYFQPSGGAAFRYIVNPRGKISTNITAGFAIHNLVPWTGANGRGHSWSVLGLGTPTIPRLAFFLRAEQVAGKFGRNYLSVRPQVFFQSQRGIAYMEGGADVSLSRQFAAGLYFHASRPNEGQPSTNWGSVQLETALFAGDATRIDLGFGYAYNVSGLRNFVGNVYEVTLRFNFYSSPVCSLAGQPLSDNPNRYADCYTFLESAGKNKVYENIWYRANR